MKYHKHGTFLVQSADLVQTRASIYPEIVDELTLYWLPLCWIRHSLSSNRWFNASKKKNKKLRARISTWYIILPLPTEM